MLSKITFSIAISTFNRNDDLYRCLEGLAKQTFHDFNIVIVNGGNEGGVKHVTDNFKNLKILIVTQQRKGIVEARNLGWIRSKADIICFIDDDLIVSSDWLENVKNTFLSDDNIGGVSGPTIIGEDRQGSRDLALFLQKFLRKRNIFLKLIGKIYLRIILENRIMEVGKILRSGAFTPGSNYTSCLKFKGLVEVDYLEACHMCFRRFLLEKIGGFDYAYTGTGEWNEPDLSFKVRSLGYRLVFNPKAITEHRISQGGIFQARTCAYERSRNFVRFYFNNIKPDNPDKIFRFGLNLCFINLYWFYKFMQTKNTNWLSGLRGTFSELRTQLCKL